MSVAAVAYPARRPPTAAARRRARALSLRRAGADPDRHGHAGAAGARHLLRLPRRAAAQPLLRRLRRARPLPRARPSDEAFFRALRNTLWWTGLAVLFQFVFGLILALLLDVPFRGRGDRAGAGLPALGGADLPDRPQLGLAVQPGDRPAAALALCARPPVGARQHPLRPRPRPVGADHRQRLVGHPVLRDHAARRAAVDPARPLRGRGHRRRQRRSSVSGRSRCPSSRRSSPSPCCCAPSGSRTSPTSSSS